MKRKFNIKRSFNKGKNIKREFAQNVFIMGPEYV